MPGLAHIRARYRAARAHALYWSGKMTFTGKRHVTHGPRAKPDVDLRYEMAKGDCETWEAEIERLTGRAPKPYDPKRLIQKQWDGIQEAIHRERKE